MEQEEKDIKFVKDNQILAKYMKELNNDVKLSEYNIREKSLTCSSIWAKWIQYLFLEKENLQRIANAKLKLKKTKLQNNKNDSILRMKSEDKFFENDETMKKLNLLSQQTQENIDYIERSLNILQNFGFNIKNCIEVIKLQLSH